MLRHAAWREAVDPERPMERFDPLVRLMVASVAGFAGGLCCGCVSLPAFFLTWRSVGNAMLHRHVARLRDDPSLHVQVASRLSLEQGSTTFGRDEGLVSLVDGSILFEGRRTSFSVPRLQVSVEHLSRKGFSFLFPTPAGNCRAIVMAVDENEMAGALQTWGPENWPAASVDGAEAAVFPPFRPQLRIWKRIENLAVLSQLAVVLGFFAAAVAAMTFDIEGCLMFGLLVVLSSVLVYGAARKKRSCLRRLRRAALTSGED